MKNLLQNKKTLKRLNYRKLAVLLITSASITTISQSIMANDYLDALSAEAESTANIVTSNQLDASEQKQFKKMEALLETERPSTYKFYTKLYPKNKERVFRFFSNDQSDPGQRMTHLQKQIMDLYFTQ